MMDLLQSLAGNKFYTSLDMNSSFTQIPIDESQRQMYTFLRPDWKRTYRYKCEPFGISQLSNVFQSIIAGEVLKDTAALIYIDDINLGTKNFEDHLKKLEHIFQKFDQYNLTLKSKKCHFATDHLECFGYMVNSRGYKPIESRIKKLKMLKTTATKRELRSHLASLAYFRNHNII